MTEQHPLTPPPELRRLWAQQAQRMDPHDPVAWMQHVSAQAARWGADQELDACCGLIGSAYVRDQVRAARRPKPPSLKEQALQALGHLDKGAESQMDTTEAVDTIRRALEALDD